MNVRWLSPVRDSLLLCALVAVKVVLETREHGAIMAPVGMDRAELHS